jgi:hypothetical protein
VQQSTAVSLPPVAAICAARDSFFLAKARELQLKTGDAILFILILSNAARLKAIAQSGGTGARTPRPREHHCALEDDARMRHPRS